MIGSSSTRDTSREMDVSRIDPLRKIHFGIGRLVLWRFFVGSLLQGRPTLLRPF